MNRNEFMQALKAGKVSGAYLFEGVEENIKSERWPRCARRCWRTDWRS